jgi:ketosteroid isomerase-like protein
MNRALRLSIVALALVGLLTAASKSKDSFTNFLPTWEKAALQFLNGDPQPWKAHSSQSQDATIFGAFGGYEKGWAQVGPRYEWASAQFKGTSNENRVEYLSTGSSGDLAYTVSIEHKTTKLGTQEKAPQTFRVTQIFRREKGEWKLLHRHADPLVEKSAPK